MIPEITLTGSPRERGRTHGEAVGALMPHAIYAQQHVLAETPRLVGAEWWVQRRSGDRDPSMFLHFDIVFLM